MRNPLRHHNKNHKDTGESFEDCRVCRRDRDKCRGKGRFATWEQAWHRELEINIERDWTVPYITRYPCRWCEGWHMKRAVDPRLHARMEKVRDKWLAANGMEART